MASSRSRLVHLWHRCHHCGARPIVGRRYHCRTCPEGPDSDLCQPCHEKFELGAVKHPGEDSLGAAGAGGNHEFVVSPGRPATIYEPWLGVEVPAAGPPEVPDRFIVRPEFLAGSQSYLGAYAFVAEVEGNSRPLVLTALHVMDGLIKKKGLDTGRDLPDLVTGVRIYDALETEWYFAELGSVGPMLLLPRARTGDEEPYCERDIAAFRVPDPRGLTACKLAGQCPGVGEAIWLAVKLTDSEQRVLPAVVVEATDRTLVFKFRDASADPRYTSGAPVLNAAGEVVGINIGKGELDARTFGHANHVGNIRRHLSDAADVLAAPEGI